ncbi:hypothetical protein NDU88_002899 [Pleurodeles waltl]|uniref:Uncharacterized protein n=1 Tax=Pleurodeles waltl TaxID=8319 RepID=A0AAV7UXH5_PLEWA|nr:hypothetical protein NDU88_002899 [Pleurodeles waltl]
MRNLAHRRCSPTEVRDSVEVAAPRRDRRRSKCTDSTFRTDAAIPDFAHRFVFTLHQRYCTWGSTRIRVRCRWCRLVGNDSVTTLKEELQKALRAWVTAKSTEGQTEDEGDEEDEEECSVHNDIVGGPVMSREKVSRAGRSVSSKGLTPEELEDRQAEREYQLEQRRLALEERKLAMAHELSLREMDHRSQSSRDGGSNPTVQPERRVHIPKDLVRDYKREDDIYLWFKGYRSAFHMNLVPEAHWGAAL